jgi:hypothetical protein
VTWICYVCLQLPLFSILSTNLCWVNSNIIFVWMYCWNAVQRWIYPYCLTNISWACMICGFRTRNQSYPFLPTQRYLFPMIKRDRFHGCLLELVIFFNAKMQDQNLSNIAFCAHAFKLLFSLLILVSVPRLHLNEMSQHVN